MRRSSITAAGAALAFALGAVAAVAAPGSAPAPSAASTAPEGRWIKASFDKGYVVFTVHLRTTEVWTYDPAAGQLNQATPEPQEQSNPIPGIGIVVKKNKCQCGVDCYCPANRGAATPQPSNPASPVAIAMSISPSGVAAFPPNMSDGNYDVVVTIPSASIAAAEKHGSAANRQGAGSANKGATITFHIVVRAQHIEWARSRPPTLVVEGANGSP